jgi:hypothetical protein
MVIVNYDELSPIAKKRVLEAGYIPTSDGKRAVRSGSKERDAEVVTVTVNSRMTAGDVVTAWK